MTTQPFPVSLAATAVSPEPFRFTVGVDRDDQSSYSSVPDLKFDDEARCVKCGVQVNPHVVVSVSFHRSSYCSPSVICSGEAQL